MATVGKKNAELTQLVNEALHRHPGCETACVSSLQRLPDVGEGRNWEIPHVILGDSLITDVDRAVITIRHQLGRKFHLLRDD